VRGIWAACRELTAVRDAFKGGFVATSDASALSQRGCGCRCGPHRGRGGELRDPHGRCHRRFRDARHSGIDTHSSGVLAAVSGAFAAAVPAVALPAPPARPTPPVRFVPPAGGMAGGGPTRRTAAGAAGAPGVGATPAGPDPDGGPHSIVVLPALRAALAATLAAEDRALQDGRIRAAATTAHPAGRARYRRDWRCSAGGEGAARRHRPARQGGGQNMLPVLGGDRGGVRRSLCDRVRIHPGGCVCSIKCSMAFKVAAREARRRKGPAKGCACAATPRPPHRR
jgi:hypothetical protein